MNSTKDERLRSAARAGPQRLIAEQVADTDPDAFETRPPWPGAGPAWGTRREPQALPGLTAARRVHLQAARAEADAIAHARGQGHTWTQIGRALGEPFVTAAKRAQLPLAEATWRYATYRIMPDQQIPWRDSWDSWVRDGTTWRCWSCHHTIRETHPDNGPDAEQGHAPGCGRHRRRRRGM